MSDEIRIGLLGCGVVGTGVLQLLEANNATIGRRLGAPIVVKRIAVRDAKRERDALVPNELLTEDPMEVVSDPEVDIVVELMGGVERAGELLRAALSEGKHVVTANKALLAEQGDSLLAIAEERGLDLYFEAAVGGGIPIIRVLREALSSDEVVSLRGIVNGTSNYIMSRMQKEGIDFDVALAAAQAAGYAEADPTLDVSGGDAAHKLTILATLAFGAKVRTEWIATEGLAHIKAIDMAFAERFGFIIKPLAIATFEEPVIGLRVHPALIPKDHVLASIDGALNAVFVEGAMLGPCLISGRGAGATPTAMSVVSDVVDVGRNMRIGAHVRVPTRSFHGAGLREYAVREIDEHLSRFYVRFSVLDRPGVLGQIASILGERGISISELVQDEQGDGEAVAVVMLTHRVREGDLRAALRTIDTLPCTDGPTCAIRVEDL